MFGNTTQQLLDAFESQRFGKLPMLNGKSNFPRINVSMIDTDERGNGTYFIEYALAGYSRDDINLEEDSTTYAGHNFNVLKLTAKTSHGNDVKYLQHNIAYRDIEHSMLMSPQDHVSSATYVDGILRVEVVRTVKTPNGRSINIS